MIYKDYDGNSFAENYAKAFKAAGGWQNVGGNAAMGAFASAIGEFSGARKMLKSNEPNLVNETEIDIDSKNLSYIDSKNLSYIDANSEASRGIYDNFEGIRISDGDIKKVSNGAELTFDGKKLNVLDTNKVKAEKAAQLVDKFKNYENARKVLKDTPKKGFLGLRTTKEYVDAKKAYDTAREALGDGYFYSKDTYQAGYREAKEALKKAQAELNLDSKKINVLDNSKVPTDVSSKYSWSKIASEVGKSGLASGSEIYLDSKKTQIEEKLPIDYFIIYTINEHGPKSLPDGYRIFPDETRFGSNDRNLVKVQGSGIPAKNIRSFMSMV